MDRTRSSDQTVESGWKDKGMRKREKLDLRDEVEGKGYDGEDGRSGQ